MQMGESVQCNTIHSCDPQGKSFDSNARYIKSGFPHSDMFQPIHSCAVQRNASASRCCCAATLLPSDSFLQCSHSPVSSDDKVV